VKLIISRKASECEFSYRRFPLQHCTFTSALQTDDPLSPSHETRYQRSDGACAFSNTRVIFRNRIWLLRSSLSLSPFSVYDILRSPALSSSALSTFPTSQLDCQHLSIPMPKSQPKRPRGFNSHKPTSRRNTNSTSERRFICLLCNYGTAQKIVGFITSRFLFRLHGRLLTDFLYQGPTKTPFQLAYSHTERWKDIVSGLHGQLAEKVSHISQL
jgi:hypothetical protein